MPGQRRHKYIERKLEPTSRSQPDARTIYHFDTYGEAEAFLFGIEVVQLGAGYKAGDPESARLPSELHVVAGAPTQENRKILVLVTDAMRGD